MKTIKLFMAALAVSFAFASCNKAVDSNDQNGPETNGKLTIQIADTKALVAGTGVDDVITDLNVFVIKKDGSSIIKKLFVTAADLAKSPKKEWTVNTSAEYLYVIANIGDQVTSTGKFVAATKLADIKSGMFDFDNMGVTPVVMSGKSNKLVFDKTSNFPTSEGSVDGYKLAEATIALQMIPSKFDITVVNNMENYSVGPSPSAMQITGVAILYSGAYSYYLPGTDNGKNFEVSYTTVNNLGNRFFRSGVKGWGMEASVATDNVLSAKLAKTWNGISPNFAETFYALPTANTYKVGDVKPTIVTVLATYNDGKSTVARYYPIKFDAPTGNRMPIVSGNHYQITITLKGDANLDGATDDPELPFEDANINMTVSVKPWVPVAITEEFK